MNMKMRVIFVIKNILLSLSLLSSIFAHHGTVHQVGDIMPDFSVPYCSNGTGDYNFYPNCNGDQNGGYYKITWINLYTSW
jgi:hypothetical protein